MTLAILAWLGAVLTLEVLAWQGHVDAAVNAAIDAACRAWEAIR